MPRPNSPRRRNAERKAERRNKATAKIIEEAQLHRDPAKFEAAKKILTEKLGLGPDANLSSRALLKRLFEQQISHELVRVSRKKYLEALDIAYAGAQMIETGPNPEELLDLACKRSGASRTAKSDYISLVLRAVIDYGRTESGKPDPDSRRLWSRDANAIRFLKRSKVPVGGVIAYQKENKRGVDSWSRAWSQFDKAGKHSNDVVEIVAASKSAPTGGSSFSAKTASLSGQLKEGKSAVVLVTKLNGVLEYRAHAKVHKKIVPKVTKSGIWKKIEKIAGQSKKATVEK